MGEGYAAIQGGGRGACIGGRTVKKANLFSSFHENLRFWAGKTPFPWREYFSHCPQSVLYNAWTEIMFPSVKRKTAGDIIYPQCFFQFSRVEKYSLLGRRKTRKTSGMRKETKIAPSPFKWTNSYKMNLHMKNTIIGS